MTDRETLYEYRLSSAEETLREAEKMLEQNFSPRSVANRAYYSAFYAVLALFIKSAINVKTSKHQGVLSLFDKEFILSGKLEKECSKILHKLFNTRLKADYQDLPTLTDTDADEAVRQAKEFVSAVKKYINNPT